eukprot:ANDGO_03764.mRNA.1 hypothetical protein
MLIHSASSARTEKDMSDVESLNAPSVDCSEISCRIVGTETDDARQRVAFLMELMDEFLHLCEQIEVKPYLDFGTLLGCLRNRCIIPWDTDADVTILKVDYVKLINYFSERQGTVGVLRLDVAVWKDPYCCRMYHASRECTAEILPGQFMPVGIDVCAVEHLAFCKRVKTLIRPEVAAMYRGVYSFDDWWVMPLKQRVFLGRAAWVPQVPEAIMLLNYGQSWREPDVQSSVVQTCGLLTEPPMKHCRVLADGNPLAQVPPPSRTGVAGTPAFTLVLDLTLPGATLAHAPARTQSPDLPARGASHWSADTGRVAWFLEKTVAHKLGVSEMQFSEMALWELVRLTEFQIWGNLWFAIIPPRTRLFVQADLCWCRIVGEFHGWFD